MALSSTARLYRNCLRQRQQRRSYSIFSEFVKKVKSGVESDPELKKTVEVLKETTESVKERTKVAGEQVQKAAVAAQTAVTQQLKQAAQVSSVVQETITQASKTLRETVQTSTAQPQEDQPTPSSPPNSSSAAVPSDGPASQEAVSSSHEPRSSNASASDQGVGNEQTNSSAGQESSKEGTSQQKSSKPNAFISRARNVAELIYKEVKEVVFPQEEVQSALRAAAEPAKTPPPTSGESSLAVVQQPETAWQKQWREMREKFGSHPLFYRFQRLGNNRVVEKGREVAEDLKERWETSDSPLVHRIQDMQDSLFSETEAARALREIRSRDSSFDMVTFLRRLKSDVSTVIKGYLTGDEAVLKEHCSPEMVERLMGIVTAMHAQGVYSDSTILDTSEIELVDLKFLEDEPIVVVQFNCQQINCTRDKFGNVVDGAADSVHRVYYYWALQQDSAAYIGVDGNHYPPRWVLKEMLVRGMHNLL